MRTLLERSDARGSASMTPEALGRLVDPAFYGDLLISHRRMERLVYPEHHLRGLRDLDTGEVFLIEERRLFDARR
jgi:hypothetical protein